MAENNLSQFDYDQLVGDAMKWRASGHELLEACKALLKLIEDGVLVRNIERDSEPGFALRQLPLVMALKNTTAAIARVEGAEHAPKP